MEKICKNCKYWEYDREVGNNRVRVGDCDCPKMIYTRLLNHLTEKDQLGYWDFEGYQAGITFGEEFGCIHWKSK